MTYASPVAGHREIKCPVTTKKTSAAAKSEGNEATNKEGMEQGTKVEQRSTFGPWMVA